MGKNSSAPIYRSEYRRNLKVATTKDEQNPCKAKILGAEYCLTLLLICGILHYWGIIRL